MSMNGNSSVHPVSGPNPTQQNQLNETDINKMSAKYLRTRLAGNPNGRKPMFITVPSATFHDMMNKVVQIQDQFQRLSANIRRKFMNNPTVMLSWLENPDNRREGVKMGLIDDPELAYAMEQEAASKKATQEGFKFQVPEPLLDQSLRPDPEAQPSRTPPKGGKTP